RKFAGTHVALGMARPAGSVGFRLAAPGFHAAAEIIDRFHRGAVGDGAAHPGDGAHGLTAARLAARVPGGGGTHPRTHAPGVCARDRRWTPVPRGAGAEPQYR